MNRLSTGEKLLGASSLLLLILSFLPLWAKYETPGFEGAPELGIADVEGVTTRASGWSGAIPGYAKIAFIAAIICLIIVVIRAASPQTIDSMPFPLAYLYLGLGGLAALVLILAAIAGPVGQEFGGFGGLEVSRGILLLIAPLLGLAMAAGGFLHKQEEGTAAPTARGPMGGPGAGPAGPPPPPGPGL